MERTEHIPQRVRMAFRSRRRDDRRLLFCFLLSLCLNAGLAAAVVFLNLRSPREHVFMLVAEGEEALEMEPGGLFEAAAAPAKPPPEIAEERFEPPPPDALMTEREPRTDADSQRISPLDIAERDALERAPLESPDVAPVTPPAPRRLKRDALPEPETAAMPPAEASRIGADRRVQGVPEPARLASALVPRYPDSSRRRGETGVVRVRAGIGADGRCRDASVEVSSGYAALDRAALDAVRRASYVPSRMDGAPVDSEEVFLVDFRLR